MELQCLPSSRDLWLCLSRLDLLLFLFFLLLNDCLRFWLAMHGSQLLKMFLESLVKNTKQILLYMKDHYLNNTWVHIDRDFLVECSTWYLTCLLCSLVRYQVEREKRNSVSTSSHVFLCFFLYKYPNNDFLMIFWRFPNSSGFWRFSKSCLKARQSFPNVFRKFLKISEDN